MDEILKPLEKKRGINPVFVIGVVVGLAIVGIALYALSFKPPMEEQTAQLLTGALRAGDPTFDAVNKDILIATDHDNTVESPTGLGTISMYIKGNVRNKGSRNVTALEVNVAIITQKNEVIRDKDILVVPVQQPDLPAGGTIPITLTLDGFSSKDDRANIRWKVTAIKVE
jgi:hypothetical protein